MESAFESILYENMAKNLLALRQKKNLSQRYIASALEISLRTYQRYESGQRLPDLQTAVKLADFYGISLDSLIGRGR